MVSRPGVVRRPPRRAPPASASLVAERLLAASPEARGSSAEPPRAVTMPALARRLPPELRAHLAAALALLESNRRLLRVRHGRAMLVVFHAARAEPATAAPRDRPAAAPVPPAALAEDEVLGRYAAVVAAARGWPDVRLAALLQDPAEIPALHAVLSTLWRAGRAVLSLGDWSLASEEQRAAALPLHGERYLLVRVDPP